MKVPPSGAISNEGVPPIPFIGSFESTFQPAHDIDVAETTGHIDRFEQDLDLLQSCGISRLRYPVRWHRIEASPDEFDWRATDRSLGRLRERGLRPIVDLVHHTSYPRWLTGGFGDQRFAGAYLRYAEAVARRYDWIEEYTLFNEPFSTLMLCGHEAIWPPYRRGVENFLALVQNVLPAVAAASRLYVELLPEAKHVYVDSCERHTSAGPGGEEITELANDRRFFVADLFLGAHLDRRRPFVRKVLEAGFEDLLSMPPGCIDVLGLDYYAHCQWEFSAPDTGIVPSPNPASLRELIVEYWDRYRLPCILGETNIRGFGPDRATWLKYTLEQCEQARDAGVPLVGYCWFPFIDSADWDSLLYRCDGNIDPVGVYSLDCNLDRQPTSMSESFRLAASGAPAAALPAFELQEPVASWLEGFGREMSHWRWQPPPRHEIVPPDRPTDARIELKIVEPRSSTGECRVL
ncbi:MAG: family 1 glycosylhydrolase [Actinomycetota bacterium]|nr:family 1 glycosylhydrolase [Actinomycetota bacterium]